MRALLAYWRAELQSITSHIHNVESVQVFDVPMPGHAPGEVRASKDVYIKLKGGAEIILYCYLGVIKEGGE